MEISSSVLIMTLSLLTVAYGELQTVGSVHFSSHLTQSKASSNVRITLVLDAVEKGAVCLDGSPPSYYLDRGVGSGSNKWVIDMEGGGWCNNLATCRFRAKTKHGSSNFLPKAKTFSGILSSIQSANPDFYNWNRVRVSYCDGSSFTGDVEEVNQTTDNLYFRGKRIWQAVMEDLLAKGLYEAEEALLTGCSAGGLTTIIHCDEFRALLPLTTKVKCLSDAGFFLNVDDVSGHQYIRNFFHQTVKLHGSAKNLDRTCTTTMNPGLCFFPQYLLKSIKAPLFLLNSAYDYWQITNSLVSRNSDPNHEWQLCKYNFADCDAEQINKLEDFRNLMLRAVEEIQRSEEGGLFIDSCYLHCQTGLQNLWFAADSPKLGSRSIAGAVADWYFDRHVSKHIDGPYPSGTACNKNQTLQKRDFLDFTYSLMD